MQELPEQGFQGCKKEVVFPTKNDFRCPDSSVNNFCPISHAFYPSEKKKHADPEDSVSAALLLNVPHAVRHKVHGQFRKKIQEAACFSRLCWSCCRISRHDFHNLFSCPKPHSFADSA